MNPVITKFSKKIQVSDQPITAQMLVTEMKSHSSQISTSGQIKLNKMLRHEDLSFETSG